MPKSLKKGDLAVIAAVILLAALLFIVFDTALFRSSGERLIVNADGIKTEYLLSENREFEITSNNYTIKIRIKDGMADVIQSDCPDHVCQHSGSISKTGEAIACIPARVTLSVEGEEAEYDFIAG